MAAVAASSSKARTGSIRVGTVPPFAAVPRSAFVLPFANKRENLHPGVWVISPQFQSSAGAMPAALI